MSIIHKKLVKGLGAGIGLASERIKVRKAHRSQNRLQREGYNGTSIPPQSHPEGNTPNSTNPNIVQEAAPPPLNQDNEQWALDDAQDQIAPITESREEKKKSKNIQDFLVKHPAPQCGSPSDVPRIRMHAILPQRRPKDRSRGFSLDKINDEFYRPRGLYTFILAWNPEDGAIHQTLDIINILSRASNGAGASKSSLAKKLATGSGSTPGTFEFPETAPLVFPVLDDIMTMDEKGREKTKITFFADYLDRGRELLITGSNGYSIPASRTSRINFVPRPKDNFSSRYADPNHPANSGSTISLVTGGYINPPPLGRAAEGLAGIGGRARVSDRSSRVLGRLVGLLEGGLSGGHRGMLGVGVSRGLDRTLQRQLPGSSISNENANGSFDEERDPRTQMHQRGAGKWPRNGIARGRGSGLIGEVTNGLGDGGINLLAKGAKKILGKVGHEASPTDGELWKSKQCERG
ncbi:hypothetical protein BDZ45DRAFT_769445 [Acephala macrosclerotiorum]|nr:hypothetical protein BDZ45DRAFT_769445 [Acephala macrosclerotiorum]